MLANVNIGIGLTFTDVYCAEKKRLTDKEFMMKIRKAHIGTMMLVVDISNLCLLTAYMHDTTTQSNKKINIVNQIK